MPPYPSKHQSDDDTVDSSNSDDDQPSPLMPTATQNSKSSSFAAKKRNRLTTISRKYDLDGDGELDEAEQAMRDRDVANRGFLTNDEIYAIVQEQLKAKRSAGYMKRLIAGLICFVVLLAMSNLGTSLAAAFLAKDLKADEGGSSSSSTQENGDSENVPAMRVSSTGEIASAQTVADTYSASEMTDDELLERRRLVLQEMDDDPHSHSHRRDLRACMASRSRDTNGCNNKITFDSRTIPEEEFDIIESKCGRQQNVYIQRKWGGNSGEKNQKDTRSDCICSRGSSVVVIEKKGNNKKKNKGKNNDKKNNGKKNKKEKGKKKKKEPRNRRVLIEKEDGSKLHVDCIDGKCYCGGTTLQGELHDRCVLGADECGPRLVCERDSNNKKNKNVRVSTSSRYGTCRKPTKVSSVVMKRQGGGGYCSISDGWDACDKGHYCAVDFDEYDYDFEVQSRTVKRGGYGGGNNYGDCTNDRDSCAQGYACVTPNGGDQWHCRADESWGDTMSVSSGRRSGGGGASVSGVGTCVRTVGHGQTCYSDYACGSNYVCDYGSANSRNSQAGVSYGGDCSYTGQCANGAKCVQSELNGSDRANCEYDDAYWYESSVVTGGGVCARGSVVYARSAVVNNRPSVSTCQVWGNDCTNCRSGCPGGSSCYKSPLNGSDRWNCA